MTGGGGMKTVNNSPPNGWDVEEVEYPMLDLVPIYRVKLGILVSAQFTLAADTIAH